MLKGEDEATVHRLGIGKLVVLREDVGVLHSHTYSIIPGKIPNDQPEITHPHRTSYKCYCTSAAQSPGICPEESKSSSAVCDGKSTQRTLEGWCFE